jgi:hypothetical protein
MSIPKTLVTEREADSRSSKKRSASSSSLPLSPEQPLTSESMEPAKKLVRWTTDLPDGVASVRSMQVTTPEASDSPAQGVFKNRVEKMRLREERKRSTGSRSLNDLSAGELREVMEKMEHKIHQIARKELALLNQSKKLREARNIMTNRHQKLSLTLQQALRAEDPSAIVDAPLLPPVFSAGSSRNPALIDLTE